MVESRVKSFAYHGNISSGRGDGRRLLARQLNRWAKQIVDVKLRAC